MKRWNRVTVTTTLFPHTNSRLHLGTLLHFALWNKPIHGLELFQFATASPVLPTHANTLDRSHHFEPGTFLNRRHYCDVWYNITLFILYPSFCHWENIIYIIPKFLPLGKHYLYYTQVSAIGKRNTSKITVTLTSTKRETYSCLTAVYKIRSRNAAELTPLISVLYWAFLILFSVFKKTCSN